MKSNKYKALLKEYKKLALEIRETKNNLIATEKEEDYKNKVLVKSLENGESYSDLILSLNGLTKVRRNLVKALNQKSRKAMHMNIALSLLRGKSISDCIAPSSKKKIRPESIIEFLW